jgi:hypothetical protein
MPLCVVAHGPSDGGDGMAASRQEGPEQQHEAPSRRWGGKSRLQHPQDRHGNIWDLHTLSPAWLPVAVSQLVESDGTMKGRCFPAQKGQKSS